jgi:hypothetical protein
MVRALDGLVGLDGDEVVGQEGKRIDGLLAGYRDAERNGDVRQVPDARGVDFEVFALPVHQFTAMEFADELHGFDQHVRYRVVGQVTYVNNSTRSVT